MDYDASMTTIYISNIIAKLPVHNALSMYVYSKFQPITARRLDSEHKSQATGARFFGSHCMYTYLQ